MFKKIALAAVIVLAGLSTASAQLVVETRPEVPQQRKQLPAPKDDSFVLLPGEWAAKGDQYYYVQPRYAKQRAGKKYVSGKWKKVAGGWTWKPGEWR